MNESTPVLVCAGCGTEVEWCSFCDGSGCAVAVCYGCLVVELRESAPQPHDHGG